MASVAPVFEPVRPQSHQGIHASPHPSPRIQRSVSQASFHTPGHNAYSPATSTLDIQQPGSGPLSAYPSGPHSQPMRSFTPTSLSLPLPHQNFGGSNYPSTAPPMSFYPDSVSTPLWDARGSQPMVRTISHAHPMNSATDATMSSRYSSSPHSATQEAPPTAGGGFPSINPAVFHSSNSYPMSRSTSGASDAQEYNARLLTPHADYRPLGGSVDHYGGIGNGQPTSTDIEMRKMSDSLGRMPSNRFFPAQAFNFGDMAHLGPHPQPDMSSGNTRNWGSDFALSAERGADNKMTIAGSETDYERARQQQIVNNKKLMEDMGLGSGGGGAFGRSRSVTSGGGSGGRERARNSVTPKKRLSSAEAPIRSSPRIASIHRASYADLDGGPIEEGEDEYESSEEQDVDDEDDFRPTKRAKGGARGGYRRTSQAVPKASRTKAELSLWGLLQVYKEIPHSYPLFYYTLNNDLTINSDSVPLIGSIPSTVTAMEKAETLQNFFHRGRRVLAQIDAFTARCDRKYDGPQEKFVELEFHTRIAIRDVRRKVVERCENYKYTRRDILDKQLGKNKWRPIESDMIEWRVGMSQTDPAGDLANVTLTLPTPPPHAMFQGPPSHRQGYATHGHGHDRQIRPFPNRSRVGSLAPPPHTARTVSVTMAEPGSSAPFGLNTPTTGPVMNYGYSTNNPPRPMYGEDQVPLSVQMPLTAPLQSSSHATSPLPNLMTPTVGSSLGQATTSSSAAMGQLGSATLPPVPEWGSSRGIKRSLSDDGEDDNEED